MPEIGKHYRSSEIEFWNEVIPVLLRYPNADLSLLKARRPRPFFLDIADGIGKYANASSFSSSNFNDDNTKHDDGVDRMLYEAGFDLGPPSNLAGDGKRATGNDLADSQDSPADARRDTDPLGKNYSAISLIFAFGLLFLLINVSALIFIYSRRHRLRKRESQRRVLTSVSVGITTCDMRAGESRKKFRFWGFGRSRRELAYCSSESKPDINELIKNDKAYDNNSNFGRKSKLSRENSSSTIDARVKVREWIQQEIVHR